MAKEIRIILALVLTVLLTIVSTVTPALAEMQEINFVLIGGDGDSPSNWNNLFQQSINGHLLSDYCTTKFIESVSGDYSNDTAKQQGRIAEHYLSDSYYNCLAGFSHGGQSVFFMNLEKVNEIFLFDACAKIQQKCNDPKTCGDVWAKWAISAAAKGINLHIYATNGENDISVASQNTIYNIKNYGKTFSIDGITLEKYSDNIYFLYKDGEYCSYIEVKNVGGIHGEACIKSAKYVFSIVGSY